MRGLATLSPSKQWYPATQVNPATQSAAFPEAISFQLNRNRYISSRKSGLIYCSSTNASNVPNPNQPTPPLVVVGSANADVYVEIDRLPGEGETISAKAGQTLAGGKGANQAVCGGKLSYPTYFVGQIGEDAHGKLIAQALVSGGVHLDHLNTVPGSPTGHAVVMLLPDGQNSIIIVGGANMSGWPATLSGDVLEVVKNAGIVLLQREIPDFVNVQFAKVRRLNLVSSFFVLETLIWNVQ